MRAIEANLLNEDFIDFLKSLNRCGVESILVGGYAVILHGYHRTTGDMDIGVKPSEENYRGLQSAFEDFGLPLDAIALEDFLSPNRTDVFTFGQPPVAIDLLTKVAGLDFDGAFRSSEAVVVDGAPTRLLSVQSLRVAKLAAGRHKDLDDSENLK